MTYHIITIGCQMNKADSERCAAYLEARGYQPAKNEKTADLVILTTCGVRQSAEDRVYGIVNQIKKKNPKSIVIITGCLSQRPDVQRRLRGKVDVWLPIIELPQLQDKILAVKEFSFGNEENSKHDSSIATDYLSIIPKYNSKFTAFVPIGNGCNNFCSYCVVPYARGRETYRPAAEIIKEVRELLRKGYKEINLIAQNVNSYRSGYDSGLGAKPPKNALDFPQLLRKINALPGNFWLRFSSSHPKDMSPELIKAVGECAKVCEHIHLAVQSGDDKMLAAMNRKYTAAHYRGLIKKLRLAVKKRTALPLAVTTDLIVGFPGETRAQYLNSVKLFKDVKFDMAYIARYSPRHGTVSAKMKDNVNREEKKRREQALETVLKKTARKNNEWYLGKVVDVLISGRAKTNEYYGQTRTAKNVRLSGNNMPQNIIGRIVLAKINAVQDFGLAGSLYEKTKSKKIK